MLPIRFKPLPYQVSKFQDTAALLERVEIEALFSDLEEKLGKLYFYQIGAVVERTEYSLEEAVAIYDDHLQALKNGQPLPSFSLALTLDPNTLYRLSIEGGGEMAKLAYPTPQMRAEYLSYIPALQEFKKKLYGKGLIPWGVQFTYPQLFQDSVTQSVHNALLEYGNGRLFKEIQRWMRHHSKPITFQTREGVVKSAIRMGGQCAGWVNHHPQLVEAGLGVIQMELMRTENVNR